MATVEIPDDVFEGPRAQARRRFLKDDPSSLLVQPARAHLVDVCAPGFDRDGLTGSGMRQALRRRINEATRSSSWTDRTTYRARFLCIDLEYFKKYIDIHGLTAGDVVLRGLAERLQAHYGSADVYRFGGDELVVVLGDREAWLPEAPADITLTHAIVEIATHRGQHRNHHAMIFGPSPRGEVASPLT